VAPECLGDRQGRPGRAGGRRGRVPRQRSQGSVRAAGRAPGRPGDQRRAVHVGEAV